MVTAAVLAVPATASAAEWTENTTPLAWNHQVTLTGTFDLQPVNFSGSHFECDVDAEATLLPDGEGEITAFEFDQESCEGDGMLSGCELEGSYVDTPLPLQATNVFEPLAHVSDFEWLNQLGQDCIYSSMYVHGDFDLAPDDSEAISSFAIDGSASTPFGPANLSGNLDIDPAATYGIQ